MTYNLCYFLGNKSFVFDFLERGLLCCVCLRLTGKDLSGENINPLLEIRRAYCSNLSGVFAVIRQQDCMRNFKRPSMKRWRCPINNMVPLKHLSDQ